MDLLRSLLQPFVAQSVSIRSVVALGDERVSKLAAGAVPRGSFDSPAATDLLLLLSRWEGVPLAMLDAMAHGSVVVATAVGAIPEVARDRDNARLIWSWPGMGDRAIGVEAATIVEELLDDPSGSVAMRQRAVETAWSMSWDTTADAILSIVDSAAAWVYLNNGALLAIVAVPSVIGMMLGARIGARVPGAAAPSGEWRFARTGAAPLVCAAGSTPNPAPCTHRAHPGAERNPAPEQHGRARGRKSPASSRSSLGVALSLHSASTARAKPGRPRGACECGVAGAPRVCRRVVERSAAELRRSRALPSICARRSNLPLWR